MERTVKDDLLSVIGVLVGGALGLLVFGGEWIGVLIGFVAALVLIVPASHFLRTRLRAEPEPGPGAGEVTDEDPDPV
jgi:uncharacterized membrane protein YjjP (DUF1212 family)